MIIVLKADVKTDEPDVKRLIDFAESYPDVRTELHQIQGATRTLSELYLIGSTGVIRLSSASPAACAMPTTRSPYRGTTPRRRCSCRSA